MTFAHSHQLRQDFLGFFKKKGHTAVPSSPVIPHADPTLLFVNAGMNQFKDVFLGTSQRDYSRAVSSQKCIRVGGKHNDLENVGHTSRHLTFFEMLGNFSFGDYFKKEAIDFAWEATLNVFGFDPHYLYATVFHEDRESFALWQRYLPDDRIIPMGEKDNFWAMGDTGPCGPCSELLYDRGPAFGSAKTPQEDSQGERFFEFWNLVFMQYNRTSAGILESLPKKSVDTGAGLERVVSLKMGVKTLFETDILLALIRKLENLCGHSYNPNGALAPSFHVIADHLRTLAFASADGAQPSNLDRGYVLRKLLRRAVRYGKNLGLEEPFLAKLLPTLSEWMGSSYPELISSDARTAQIVTEEEQNFYRTLKRGGNLLGQVIDRAKTKQRIISGEDAFKLKDTYGLPLEEIVLLAKDQHLSVDIAAFDQLENQAKERSRAARKKEEVTYSESLFSNLLKEQGETRFVGHTNVLQQATIIALVHQGQFVDLLREGQEGSVILDQTPFYAEKGGQVGDRGKIFSEKSTFDVLDCQTLCSITIHLGKINEGELKKGDRVNAHIDTHLRQLIANNHTATHLLHLALQKVLGDHIRQAGSLVDSKRLRFDFSHHKPLTLDELKNIEEYVNREIRANRLVQTYEIAFEEVQKKTQVKQFFGEKYGSWVRVVDIEESKELCGGTHVKATGELGLFKIIRESALAAGIRRIEAETAECALQTIRSKETLLSQLSDELNVQESQLVEKTQKLLQEKKELEVQLKAHMKKGLQTELVHWLQDLVYVGDLAFLIKELPLEMSQLKEVADLLLAKKIGAFLIAKDKERCQLLAILPPSHLNRGFSAVAWIQVVAPIVNGRGGGKKEMAQGSGADLEKIPEALIRAREWVTTQTSP